MAALSEDHRPVLAVPPAPPVPDRGFLNLGHHPHPLRTLAIDSQHLSLDGRPWMPVMGEFHYSRCPAGEWATELAKLRAGGVDVVATYVFWNHHEPQPGRWRWDGQRDLRRFLQLAAAAGLLVYLRPGPWCHGEVRLGGFPDWLPATGPLRCNDAGYLGRVAALFGQVAQQVRGLLWRDAGPVIGLQLENEYGETGPGRGAEHISALKQLALDAGLTVPLYTVTGWPTLDIPAREVLPVSGAYADGFWQGARGPLPPSGVFLFNTRRVIGEMGNVDGTPAAGLIDTRRYPFCLAEAGGGMHQSYHRRPVLGADDVVATILVQLGSGANLVGYYMFHGGTNPVCATGPLNETQASGYPNDVPQWGYDFHAPLGAHGQVRPSWGRLRLLHSFMQGFGDQLAPLAAVLPAAGPFDPADRDQPRLALRAAGRGDAVAGFVFANHHVRHHPLPPLPALQWLLQAEGTPAQPMPLGGPLALQPGQCAIWPVGQRLGGVRLAQATLQPFTRWQAGASSTWVGVALDGLPAELVIDADGLAAATLDGQPLPLLALDGSTAALAGGGLLQRQGTHWLLRLGTVDQPLLLALTDVQGHAHQLLVLPQALAQACQRVQIGGQPRLLLSSHPATCSPAGELALHRPAHQPGWWQLWPGEGLSAAPGPLPLPGLPGAWARSVAADADSGPWPLQPVAEQAPGPTPALRWGPHLAWRDGPVPLVPDEADHAAAARWALPLPAAATAAFAALQARSPGARLWLQLDVVGDVLRLWADGTVVDDRFFDGSPWTLAVDRWQQPGGGWPVLALTALPIDPELPVFLEDAARAQARAAAAHGGAVLQGAQLQLEAVDRVRPLPAVGD
ncbi:beta-galactosidase [Pseudaquabacterium pictum]|uniref:Glycoside hydrolase 35 catalytic domain-containing protein n=1 Tax=Pseudaquabacterium pictum TaxID=2315236 RepID=A0A480AQZ4_9BURK|nr:beta-galactosidase [Rubrivivax pictus]GCL62707.1 hypothetical protein AQPW35_17880 [Rubrivivax pictus]